MQLRHLKWLWTRDLKTTLRSQEDQSLDLLHKTLTNSCLRILKKPNPRSTLPNQKWSSLLSRSRNQYKPQYKIPESRLIDLQTSCKKASTHFQTKKTKARSKSKDLEMQMTSSIISPNNPPKISILSQSNNLTLPHRTLSQSWVRTQTLLLTLTIRHRTMNMDSITKLTQLQAKLQSRKQ